MSTILVDVNVSIRSAEKKRKEKKREERRKQIVTKESRDTPHTETSSLSVIPILRSHTSISSTLQQAETTPSNVSHPLRRLIQADPVPSGRTDTVKEVNTSLSTEPTGLEYTRTQPTNNNSSQPTNQSMTNLVQTQEKTHDPVEQGHSDSHSVKQSTISLDLLYVALHTRFKRLEEIMKHLNDLPPTNIYVRKKLECLIESQFCSSIIEKFRRQDFQIQLQGLHISHQIDREDVRTDIIDLFFGLRPQTRSPDFSLNLTRRYICNCIIEFIKARSNPSPKSILPTQRNSDRSPTPGYSFQQTQDDDK